MAFNPDQERDERGRWAGGGESTSPVGPADRPRNYDRNTPVSAKEMRARRLADAQSRRIAVARANRPQKIDRARALHRAVGPRPSSEQPARSRAD